MTLESMDYFELDDQIECHFGDLLHIWAFPRLNGIEWMLASTFPSHLMHFDLLVASSLHDILPQQNAHLPACANW